MKQEGRALQRRKGSDAISAARVKSSSSASPDSTTLPAAGADIGLALAPDHLRRFEAQARDAPRRRRNRHAAASRTVSRSTFEHSAYKGVLDDRLPRPRPSPASVRRADEAWEQRIKSGSRVLAPIAVPSTNLPGGSAFRAVHKGEPFRRRRFVLEYASNAFQPSHSAADRWTCLLIPPLYCLCLSSAPPRSQGPASAV